jgi:hypothetical protein
MLIDGVLSAATVTCAANDKIIVMAISTTQFMLSRIKADGTAQVTAGSNGGATTTSSAVSITLTAASSRVQAVTMTASDLAVTLPNATTLTTGGPLYVISNTGNITFLVNDSTGASKAGLGVGMTAAFYCTDISTAAGVWVVGNENHNGAPLADIFASLILNVNAVVSTSMSVAMLTSTKAICTYGGSSGYLQSVIFDVSGSTITAGAVLTVNAVASAYTSVAMLTSTKAICAYRGASNYLQSVIFDVPS